MNEEQLSQLREELKRDEGVRNKVYNDTEGIPTIGVGRNLQDVGLSDDEIDFLLSNDIRRAEESTRAIFPNLDTLSDTRQRVLVNMTFNMGQTRLQGFHNMIAAVNRGDFNTAAAEMLDSRWARQVGQRAQRLAQMMREG